MNAILRPALTLLLLLTLLTGVAMPLAMTGVAQAVFPWQANGSLIQRNNTVVGSVLIGQTFSGAGYFHGRPSATTTADPDDAANTRPAPYNAAASGASQLGPTSAALLRAVEGRKAVNGPGPLPADAAYASGSGLDPHISPANALRQVARVAAARGMEEARLRTLVEQSIEGRELGILGEPRVNVLRLNLALDAFH